MGMPDSGSNDKGPNANTQSQMSGSASDVVQARDVTGGIHFHGSPNTSGLAPAQLPGDVRDFVNRVEDIETLTATLCGPDSGPRQAKVCVVTGTPGVGKTSLAVRWAHAIRDQFPDGQLYVNLRGYDQHTPADPHEVLGRFLIALGLAPGSVPADLESRGALYRSLLSSKRILIVLDNAATATQVRPLLPGTGASRTLVTSRGVLSGLSTRDGARRVTLDLFPEEEAVALLQSTTSEYRVGDTAEEFAELAQLCARLPLALRIAAERAAAHPRMKLATLIQALRTESSLWDSLSTQDTDEADAVRTVFAWSYRALPEPEARLFRLLGLLPGADFPIRAAAALGGLGLAVASRLLDNLVDAHLVEQTAAERYQFHDLLRAYASDQAAQADTADEIGHALRRALQWYLHTAAALVDADAFALGHLRVQIEPPDAGVLRLEFSDYAQAIDWFHEEQANLTAMVRLAARTGQQRIAWQIPATLRTVYDRERAFDDWVATGEIGLAAARTPGNEDGEALLLSSLALARYRAGQLTEAAELNVQLLELCRSRGDFYNEVRAHNELGLINIRLHRMQEAVEQFELCDSLCAEHGLTELAANAPINLAQAFVEFGRPDEAVAMAERAIAICQAGGDRQAELAILVQLSAAKLALGELPAAREHALRALAMAEDSKSRAQVGTALLHLGAVRAAEGDGGEALDAFQRSGLAARRVGDRRIEAQALDGTALAYRVLGQVREAEDFQRAALTTYRSMDDSWRVAGALARLAGDLDSAEGGQEALTSRQEALELVARFEDPSAQSLRTALIAAIG
jgi:tetratricopeptide (TPR) repeat protein